MVFYQPLPLPVIAQPNDSCETLPFDFSVKAGHRGHAIAMQGRQFPSLLPDLNAGRSLQNLRSVEFCIRLDACEFFFELHHECLALPEVS
jgi:hypothetical protein